MYLKRTMSELQLRIDKMSFKSSTTNPSLSHSDFDIDPNSSEAGSLCKALIKTGYDDLLIL